MSWDWKKRWQTRLTFFVLIVPWTCFGLVYGTSSNTIARTIFSKRTVAIFTGLALMQMRIKTRARGWSWGELDSLWASATLSAFAESAVIEDAHSGKWNGSPIRCVKQSLLCRRISGVDFWRAFSSAYVTWDAVHRRGYTSFSFCCPHCLRMICKPKWKVALTKLSIKKTQEHGWFRCSPGYLRFEELRVPLPRSRNFFSNLHQNHEVFLPSLREPTKHYVAGRSWILLRCRMPETVIHLWQATAWEAVAVRNTRLSLETGLLNSDWFRLHDSKATTSGNVQAE